MQHRHLSNLLTKLERAMIVGCVEITKDELCVWFDQKRFTHPIWGQVHSHWMDLLANTKKLNDHDRSSKLLVGDLEGSFVLVFGRGLKVGDKAWFRDMRELAKLDYEKNNWESE